MEIKRYKSGNEALVALTETLIGLINAKGTELFHLSISGGDTPKNLFRLWVDQYKEKIDWQRLRFYWVDERCVPPEDPESNYGQAKQLLFDPLNIPPAHIYRMRGEADPEVEAKRYATMLHEQVPEVNGLPRFDCIMLGVGGDMHTASIFPGNLALLTVKEAVTTATHPVSGQRRVTLTGPVLLNDVPLLVPVIGPTKAPVVNALAKGLDENNPTPSAYVVSKATSATVITDVQ
ncbi:MAG: 6-phosphogluconolactonase [Parabacteroides sp.]|nr:6-phosphogluconolactonase [Parabacteroides sp.]